MQVQYSENSLPHLQAVVINSCGSKLIVLSFFPLQNNTDTLIPPPAPTLKAQTSPLANMFHHDEPKAPVTAERISGMFRHSGPPLVMVQML